MAYIYPTPGLRLLLCPMIDTVATELGLSAEDAAILERFRFPAADFRRLRSELAAGRFPSERNRLTVTPEPPADGDILPWPGPEGEAEWRLRCEETGKAALERGHVAVLVLNGGMATRFGGEVKGTVEVTRDHSFLEIKLLDIRHRAPKTPVFLMNSFATDHDTKAHLEERSRSTEGLEIHHLQQAISIRLTPEGELFRAADGSPSFYAPGHGDVFSTLASSEAFRTFADKPGRCVLVSNVDNLGATLDPRVVGAHLEAGKRCTVELAPKNPGDKGGAPARLNGKLQIIEGFRFPTDFDQDRIDVFNTNTMTFNADVFAEEPGLSWFRADKVVEDRPVVQFERLMGEITAFQPSAYLQVPRSGNDGRFMPVKVPADLARLRGEIEARFETLLL